MHANLKHALFKVMIPTCSCSLRNGKKYSVDKKRQTEKKKSLPSDEIDSSDAAAPPEPTAIHMNEMLRQFQLINDRVSSFETTIKNDVNALFYQLGPAIKDKMS